MALIIDLRNRFDWIIEEQEEECDGIIEEQEESILAQAPPKR